MCFFLGDCGVFLLRRAIPFLTFVEVSLPSGQPSLLLCRCHRGYLRQLPLWFGCAPMFVGGIERGRVFGSFAGGAVFVVRRGGGFFGGNEFFISGLTRRLRSHLLCCRAWHQGQGCWRR
jgi:hypothetical protein